MRAVFTSLAKAIGQLGDRAIVGVLAKSIGITLVIFTALGFAFYFIIAALEVSVDWGAGGWIEAILAISLAAISAWFLFRVVALAVLQFFADEVVAAVEAQHYPDLAQRARKLPFREDLANSMRGLGRTIGFNLLALPVALILFLTGVGPALVFLFVNAVLLGRELTDMAWLRHCGSDARQSPVRGVDRALLGGTIALIMVVPIANLFAPIIGAAAGTHLTHSAMAKRGARGATDA